jgi:Ion channel
MGMGIGHTLGLRWGYTFETRFIRNRIEINGWSWFFLVLNLLFLFFFPVMQRHFVFWLSWLVLWAIPFSRIWEMGYAFYNDSFDQLKGQKPRSGLTRGQRLKLLGRSYFEVAVCYASLYLALPGQSFRNNPAASFESLYFSWIAITTTGFGDIVPATTFARVHCLSDRPCVLL